MQWPFSTITLCANMMMSQNHFKNQTDTSFYYCTSKTYSHNVWVGLTLVQSYLNFFFHRFYIEPIRRPAETQQPLAKTGRKNIARQKRSGDCLSITLIIPTFMFYFSIVILKKWWNLAERNTFDTLETQPFFQ